MNVEEITHAEVEELVATISSAATAQLQQFAARKKENALIIELNASGKSDRERLVGYLERTTLDPFMLGTDRVRYTRTNQYLREQLKISPPKFKALRDELEAAEKIIVITRHGTIMIYLFRYV